MMSFDNELKFQNALIEMLKGAGWTGKVLCYPTEKDLINNWANILYENNRGVDRLNDTRLTSTEIGQILDQIKKLKTPFRLNGFINGGSVSIKRDNPQDKEHFGKEVSLKIYNRLEIAGGQSCYQIAVQPKFTTNSNVFPQMRGDLMLLINGIPVIHIELKRSKVPVSQASTQIERYSKLSVFSGLFSLVQIFVAMTPEETIYFANPGIDSKFNSDFYFHWADFNNEPINDWDQIARTLLSIPMAHQLIGFYTVADDTDGTLKVMRSYQYFAANAISDKVAKTKWGSLNQLGGYIWHTTGSGKTMTSFKTAQLISTSKDADKVVFLMDRIELGTQSLKEYRNFAGAGLTEEQKRNTVQETEDTNVLIGKLKSKNPADTLIVTSIQKMSNISEDNISLKSNDIEIINSKCLVFIVDEAHRSTFGEMLITIKQTFKNAIFFGFTGTPIQTENQKHMNTTATVFGDELHRYSIADGIRDKNVLGFDPYKVLTYSDKEVRKAVALDKAKAASEQEAMENPIKQKTFLHYMRDVPMAGSYESGKDGKLRYVRGIEDYLPKSQYRIEAHQKMVVKDIVDNWFVLSQGNKFHAIFATSSIPEAIEYYKRIKESSSNLKVTALFDPSIDNNEGFETKVDGLEEIITDYNTRYSLDYSVASFDKMKKDIAARLAHKKPYERIDIEPQKQIDLLIVVNQMLTGFDSKWINTLYLDKELEYENIIQAFSRTNRVFGPDKPFGTIKYYRKPHTMQKHIEDAIKLYSGNKPLGLFAQRLYGNLNSMNFLFSKIKDVFETAGISNFERLPDEISERKEFVNLFNEFNEYLSAARIQGFTWKKLDYTFLMEELPDNSKDDDHIHIALDETTYLILVQRYKELINGGHAPDGFDVPYDINGSITEIRTDKIDADYMNSRFDKFIKILETNGTDAEELKKAEMELHSTFASLSQEDQKYANMLLHDIQTGDVNVIQGKSLRDYIAEYCCDAKNEQLKRLINALGVDEILLKELMSKHVSEDNINEFGRYESLKKTINIKLAKEFFERILETVLPLPKVRIKADKLLREFIIRGGFDIEGYQ